MDALRQELFVAKFGAPVDDHPTRLEETAIVAEQAWLDSLQPGEYVTGPAVARLRDRLPIGVIPTEPAECWQPTANAVGQVAWQAFQDGQRDDVWKIVPQYYRISAAEEKRARRT